MSEIFDYVKNICEKARRAAPSLAILSTGAKNALLLDAADRIEAAKAEIAAANQVDMDGAAANGVPSTMLDRLLLNEKRILDIAESIRRVAALEDPIGQGERRVRPNGLTIEKIRVPLGVIGIIYEARPNVTADAASLCLKTGNACVLRGGKEAVNSGRVITGAFHDALAAAGLDPSLLGFIDSPSRESSTALMEMRGLIDVLIPRGGRGLIKSVVENARVPVIETGAGNCHLYVDESADLDMAVGVAVNAKTSRPSVCNAIETILVHEAVASEFLPAFAAAVRPWKVEIRGDEKTRSIIDCVPASEEDFFTEYNDYIIASKVVSGLGEAVAHIGRYGTGHSEAIITRSLQSAARFQKEVDAAAVYVNASTRFTDGDCFGFGAEIGISTQKLHARGPMGLFELTTVKYLVTGDGQIR